MLDCLFVENVNRFCIIMMGGCTECLIEHHSKKCHGSNPLGTEYCLNALRPGYIAACNVSVRI